MKKNFKKGVNLFFLIPIRVNLWHFKQIFLPKIINILKYLRSTTFGCKDKGIRRSVFVAMAYIPLLLLLSV